MRLLYGTGNPGKLDYMQKAIAGLGIEMYSLETFAGVVPEVKEYGTTPLENARIKARAYFNAFHVPVFSCDTGLYFEQVPDEIQPGVHVRNVKGRYLNDDEMILYYSGLARQYEPLKAKYKNAVCLVLDENTMIESMEDSLSGESFYLVSQPHSKRVPGLPLGSLKVDINTGKYYYDLKENKVIEGVGQRGFHKFFKSIRF